MSNAPVRWLILLCTFDCLRNDDALEMIGSIDRFVANGGCSVDCITIDGLM